MREHAHQLVDRLEASQLAAVVHLLEVFLPDEDGLDHDNDTLSPAEEIGRAHV